jgi:Tol biopolymer transport system component
MKQIAQIKLIILLVATITVTTGFGQEAMEKFGKNRVQYKNFQWRYYSTENFDIYFYDGGNEIAQIATKHLEEEFDRITDLLGTVSYSKTEIFLYNSSSDLLQSNIGVNDNSFDVAGQTNFVKPLVEIAYPGNAEDFKKELVYKVSSMLINDMMFGGSLSDMFQNSFMLLLPEWYMNGAARYTAYGWDVEMDDFIRDLIRNKSVKNLNKFTAHEAELLGQSIWNFIAERYGESYISNILQLTRIIRNEERSISGTLGIPFKSFIAEWQNYYLGQTTFVDNNYVLPGKGTKLFSNKKGGFVRDIKISPDANYYAYSINNHGKYKVILGQIGKSKEKTIMKGGYKLINQDASDNMPLLSWKDENTLGIISSKYGRNWLTIYSIGAKSKMRKELTRINQVTDFDIVRNGNLAVLSADINGNNDLYLISLRRNSIKRITRDFYDDINPRFVPGTSSIIFSSNRTTDSINVAGQDIDKISGTYNIFIYNIDSTKNTVYRLTNTLSTSIKPVAVNENEFYYTSSQQGISNLYKYNLASKIAIQVSNFGSGIKDFDISYDKQYFSFVMSENGKDNLYLEPNYNLDQNIFTAQTKRQQYLNAKFVAQRLKSARAKQTLQQLKNSGTKDEPEQVEQIATSDAQPQKRASFLDQYEKGTAKGDGNGLIDTRNYTFTNPQPVVETQPEKAADEKEEILSTDGYVFDTDVVKSGKNTGSFLSNYRRLKKESDVAGPFPYQTRFSADNVVTSFVIDPLMGFGLKLETQMNDQLENHKFYGGVMIPTDLRSGSFYGEYRYLKYTVDFHARYRRKSLYRRTNEISTLQKYTLNTYELGASLPLNAMSRLSIVPFFETTNFYDLDQQQVLFPSGGPSSAQVSYAGVKFEMIYDNSSVQGMNLLQGSRGKIGLRHNEGMSDSKKSFTNFYMDLRHYQPLHREIVLAGRFFYGRYWGSNPQQYLLGGMDNWLFNNTREVTQGDPLYHEIGVDNSNILFAEYVTSLRGFDYSTFNGENAMLFNVELRVPLIRYLAQGPITSNFLRNLQFIGFYDIGSAWTGPSPFATENSVNTEILTSGSSPFSARIQNYKNPWLSSYGFGARTVLLGYYVKLDVAYPVEDYQVKDPKFFVTLGYDF